MAVFSLPVLLACISLAAVIYKLIIYPAFLSPLSKIPNAHPTSAISPLWILWNRYRQNGNRAVHAAHVKYGPIVRLGPSELSVNCVDGGIRTVYGGSFEKHDWYPRQFPCYGKYQMFSMVHGKPHSIRKRMMSNIYSKSVLQSSSQVAANSRHLTSTRLFPYIEKAAQAGTPIDVWSMNNGFTMDFMTAYLFGLSAATKWALDDDHRNQMLQMWANRKPFEFFRAEIPRTSDFLQSLGITVFPKWLDEANDAFEVLNLQMCDEAEKYVAKADKVNDEPVVFKQLKSNMAKYNEKDPEAGMSMTPADQRLEVASEMLDHLGAGHETSAICLTYLYWQLCRNPSWQDKLYEALMSLQPAISWPEGSKFPGSKPPADGIELPHAREIDEIPVLHAILMETLRLHAPIPGNEPRITPDTPCTLAGYPNIPPKIRVQAQPYSLHRNPTVFPDPETWNPARWLIDPESEQMKEMLRWFWAFGSGGRMCIGSNLAVQEMKLVVAAIYSVYTTEVAPGGDDGMEELDAYTTRPVGEKLLLLFKRR